MGSRAINRRREAGSEGREREVLTDGRGDGAGGGTGERMDGGTEGRMDGGRRDGGTGGWAAGRKDVVKVEQNQPPRCDDRGAT